jgi:drug/metabolite transporter (DMT)-like permease
VFNHQGLEDDEGMMPFVQRTLNIGASERTLAFAGLVLVSILWGSSFVAIKIAATSFSPVTIASYRVSIAAFFLLGLALMRGDRIPREPRTIVALIMLSMLGQIVPFVSLGMSGHLTSSQGSATMMGAAPLVTFLVGRFFLADEPWSWGKWFALIVGFGGILVALRAPAGHTTTSNGVLTVDLAGKLYALLAASGYAVGAILSKIASRDNSPVMVCTVTMTLSAAILLTYSLLTGGIETSAPESAWAAVLLLGTVNTALAYGVYFWLIKFAGATFASLNNYVVPAIGLAMGYVILSEKLTTAALVGFAMIIVAVFIFGRASGTRPKINQISRR